jgi:hypothetical protein
MPEKISNDVKSILAEYFEYKYGLRAAMAAEHPEDEQNQFYVGWLRRLILFIRKLPDGDPRLIAIDQAWSSSDYDFAVPDMVMIRYEFLPTYYSRASEDSDYHDNFFAWFTSSFSPQLALESVYRRDPDRVRRLITADKSAHDVVAVAHRRESVKKFRLLLSDSNFFDNQISQNRGPEAVWQEFLEENRWILAGSLTWQFLTSWDKQHLEQIVAGSSISAHGKRTDALLHTAGLVRSLVFVEIKHHRTKLLGEEYRVGCWSPSKELCGGIAQVQGTVQRAIAEIGTRLPESSPDGSEVPGSFTYLLRPRSCLILGNLAEFIGAAGGINLNKYQSFELYRRNTQEPDIITFDELLARAEGLVDASGV